MKKLRVGLDFAAPVPLHTDPSKGIFEGFEVDLMSRIADGLGLELQHSISYWKDILDDLQNKKIDLICSAATKTAGREKEFLFSQSYLDFHLCLVCRNNNLLHISNLENKKVGVRTSTEAEKYLKEKYPGKSFEYFDTNEDIYDQLATAKIDALVDDSPIAFGFKERFPVLEIAELLPDTLSQYAIMMNKESTDLKARIDGVISHLRNNGFLTEARQKWFKGKKL